MATQPKVESGDSSSSTSESSVYLEKSFYDEKQAFDLQDGRVNIKINSKLGRALSKFVPAHIEDGLVPVENDGLIPGQHDGLLPVKSDSLLPVERDTAANSDVQWDIPLNIVIQVVGSRGDVQPFAALGNELQRHGHRVRLATHGVFKQFVQQAGLEFYPIGGDPAQLMAYMVKNPGLIPGMKTLREGEIQRKRAMIAEMLDGCWKSCIEPDPDSRAPFVAQAIIANPVSFAHIHCAQALRIPLHLAFTMPWTSTRAFPHPLANIEDSKHEPRRANYLSYCMVEWMTWQGVGGVINTWRKSMDLEAIPTFEGPLLASTLKIPHTYCWSAALVPKPADWPSHIDVCGFFFREMPAYTPPPDLANFLASGPPPVYIGFGSIVIDDPTHLTAVLLEAVERSGARAIVSRGWSKIGEDSARENILYLGDCPHEWLFQRVSAVVHHGGAGTTACGLLNARPTVVVPFFGDQPFWGQMIANARAGPEPIPYKALNSKNLADAISFCLSPAAIAAAGDIARKMRHENGVKQAVASFHRQLPRSRMECELVLHQPATWLYTRYKVPLRLSSVAVEVLSRTGLNLKRKHLKHYGPSPIFINNRRWDPITSASSAGLRLATDVTSSTVGIFADPVKVYLDDHKSESETKSLARLHGEAGLAFAKGVNYLAVGTFKGGMVDVPLALAEGFRNVPRLWGEKVEDQEEITGWKSGATVAGKSLAHGFYDGVGGFFYKPYKGARDGGALGFAKGCGKGLTGIVYEPIYGAFGVFGYTGDGISKSLGRAVHHKTMKKILAAKGDESEYVMQKSQGTRDLDVNVAEIVKAFLQRRGAR